MQLHKTTLYLPEEDIFELKAYAIRSSQRSLTYHIQIAIKKYLQEVKRGKSQKKFQTLLRYKGAFKKNTFGDSVKYQRKLRQEWD